MPRVASHIARAGGDTGDTISDFKFAPATITVHVGDTITWTNDGPSPHTATATDHSFDTGTLQKGQSASHTFTTAGTFAYICTIHPFMHGSVVVQAASSTSSGQSNGGGSTSGSGSGSSSRPLGSGSGSGSSNTSGSTTPGTSTTPQATAASSASGLPVTGLNLAALVLVGGGLLSAGVALRRRSRA